MAFFGRRIGDRRASACLGRLAAVVARPAPRPSRAASGSGCIAAVIAAVNANLWMNDVLVMSETLATLGIVLTPAGSPTGSSHRPSIGRAAVVGAHRRARRAGPRRAAAPRCRSRSCPLRCGPARCRGPRASGASSSAGAVALLVLAPWIAVQHGPLPASPVLLSTNDGLTLVGANCDAVYGVDDPGGIGFWQLNCALDARRPAPRRRRPVDVVSRSTGASGIDYIKNHKPTCCPKVEPSGGPRSGASTAPIRWCGSTRARAGPSGRRGWATPGGGCCIVPADRQARVVLRRRRVPIWPLASTVVIVTITGRGLLRHRAVPAAPPTSRPRSWPRWRSRPCGPLAWRSHATTTEPTRRRPPRLPRAPETPEMVTS